MSGIVGLGLLSNIRDFFRWSPRNPPHTAASDASNQPVPSNPAQRSHAPSPSSSLTQPSRAPSRPSSLQEASSPPSRLSYHGPATGAKRSREEDGDDVPAEDYRPCKQAATEHRQDRDVTLDGRSISGPSRIPDNGAQRAVVRNDALWPQDKRVLKVRFLDGGGEWEWQRKQVRQYVEAQYHAIPMGIRFKFLAQDNTGPSDIRIMFTTYSESYVGCCAEAAQQHDPTMFLDLHPGYETREQRRLQRQRNILHEFGHALGMVHEHQHPFCNVKWNYRVLQSKTGWDYETVKNNYQRPNRKDVAWSDYDQESIMHYPVYAGDTMGTPMVVGLNTEPSEGDKKFLMAVYPLVEPGKGKERVNHTSTWKGKEKGKDKLRGAHEFSDSSDPEPLRAGISNNVRAAINQNSTFSKQEHTKSVEGENIEATQLPNGR